MNFLDPVRTEPEPTEAIDIRIGMRVSKRENYTPQIESIYNFIIDQFPELQVEHMNSPLTVTIEIKK